MPEATARSEAAAKALREREARDELQDEYVIRLPSPERLAALVAAARAGGAEVRGTIDRWNIVCLRVTDPARLKALLDTYVPVSYEHNVRIRTPSLPQPAARPPLREQDPFGTEALAWLGVPTDNSAWGEDIRVAILDTRVGNQADVNPRNLVRLELLGETAAGDYAGHGTAVAAILAGSGTETRGVAPATTLLAIQVMDDDGVGDGFTLARGILAAVDEGADVISMSLGSYADSSVVRDAIGYARSKGVALVAAGGNDSLPAPTYPARYDGVTAVTGVDAQGEAVASSNQGPEVDVAAPGWGVVTPWSGDGLVSFSGTSAATPFVAGTLAGILSSDRTLSPTQATEILLRYTDDTGCPGDDPQYGRGILNVERIQARNEPGIVDAAVTGYWLDRANADQEQLPVLVGVQNRGTVDLAEVVLQVTLPESDTQHHLAAIPVGATVSCTIPVSLSVLEEQESLTLSSTVSVPTLRDRAPDNNVKQCVVLLSPPPKAEEAPTP